MFLPDNPIEKIEEDLLGRKIFAKHLAKSVINWKENRSLIIALYGPWGSGKTSLLNIAIKYLDLIKKNNIKPRVIRFNPWMFSETDDLLVGFINEIISSLKTDSTKNKKLINKLKHYSNLLSLNPHHDELKISYNSGLSILAILGISTSQIDKFVSSFPTFISSLLLWIGVGYFLLVAISQVLKKFLGFYKSKQELEEKSINAVKNEITNILKKKSEKLLIVIDDIDRLSTQEIKQVFRIIRTNADFPNTIYLLAFDREIIEKNLSVQENISGQNYLEKIVQVNFTLPLIPKNKIYNYLFHELNQLLELLPNSVDAFFKNQSRWVKVFNSGLKNYFCSIRDIKRLMNSYKFNINQLIQDDTIEVNPIDLLAIEIIRLFEPGYYKFLHNNKTIFTEISSLYRNDQTNRDEKKKIVLDSFEQVPANRREFLKKLIFELFPQVNGFAGSATITHYDGGETEWNQELRVCSSLIFDTYFNFIPGGDEAELSMYDLNTVSLASENYENFVQLLEAYKKNGKFENLMNRLQDFTSKNDFIKQENFEHIVLALFNSYVDLPEAKLTLFGRGLDLQIVRIIFQLLKRNTNLEENYQILSSAAVKSKSLYGPLFLLGIEIDKDEKENLNQPEVIPIARIEDAKNLCVNLILDSKEKLLKEKNLLHILYRWREWRNGSEYKQFIDDIQKEDKSFLDFFDKFEYESRSQSSGEYGIKRNNKFHYNNLKEFFVFEDVKKRVELVIKKNNLLYKNHQSAIDLFLKYYDQRDKDIIDIS